MNKFLLYFALFFSSVSVISCGDKGDTPPPTDIAGEITYTLPTAGTIYINGSALSVRGNVIDNNGIASVKVEIRNTSTNSVYYQQNNSITGNPTYFDFNFNWTVAGIATTTPATVRITLTDRYSNVVTKEVSVVLES